MAAMVEINTVKRIIRVPEDNLHIIGNTPLKKLNKKDTKIKISTKRSVLALGIIIARNIPYRATERADTSEIGNIFPTTMPQAVPSAQGRMATLIPP